MSSDLEKDQLIDSFLSNLRIEKVYPQIQLKHTQPTATLLAIGFLSKEPQLYKKQMKWILSFILKAFMA